MFVQSTPIEILLQGNFMYSMHRTHKGLSVDSGGWTVKIE